MPAEGNEAPLPQSRFSVRSAATATGMQQESTSTPVSRRPSRSIPSELLVPSPHKQTPSRGSLIPRRASIAGTQREQNAGISFSDLACCQAPLPVPDYHPRREAISQQVNTPSTQRESRWSSGSDSPEQVRQEELLRLLLTIEASS